MSISQNQFSLPSSSADETLIDNVSKHPTPEGLMLTLVPAGVMPRVSAWLIDCLVRGLVLLVMFIPLAMLQQTGMGLFLILFFLINWLYPVYFEVRHSGMTPGKKRYDIYVCHDDGTPVSLQSSMIRNLIRTVDFLPFLYSVGVITLMFNKKSQRLGDMVAGTVVVYQEQENIKKIYRSVYGLLSRQNSTESLQYDSTKNKEYALNSPIFTFPLNLAEQQALLSLSDRLIFLPIARQFEITSHLSPMVESYNKLGVKNQNSLNSQSQLMTYHAVLDKATAIRGGTDNNKSDSQNWYHGNRPNEYRHSPDNGVNSFTSVGGND